jgi:hypothetical protein
MVSCQILMGFLIMKLHSQANVLQKKEWFSVGAPHGREQAGDSSNIVLQSIAPTGRSYGGLALTKQELMRPLGVLSARD